MLPFQLSSGTFRRDQRPTYSVSFWDTTCTVPQTGMGFALFDVKDLSLDLLSSTYNTHAALETLLSNQTKLTSILGYTGGVYRTGLEPNMVKYWGAGAPPGCHNSQRVLLKYSGTVVATDFSAHPITLVFGGQGKVRVWKNGAELTNGKIREPLTHAAPGTSEVSIENEAGYIIVETSVTQGDLIEVYYCQNGELWGGLFGKVLPAQGLTTDWSTFRTALRDAPMIGAGFIAASTASQVKVPNVISAGMEAAVNQIRQFTLDVALNDAGKANGFFLENVGGMNQLTDNRDSTIIMRPGRLIHADGGFLKTGNQEELYSRFTGHITSITPAADGMSATILCQGLESKIEGVYDENYPDMLSYLANGYIDREWLGFPVYPISAFDAWPLETAVASLCYRAGIDATNLGKSPFTASPAYGRWGYTLYTSQTALLGQARFFARALADSTQLIYLQRNKNYGNVGVLQKDYLPKDDEYLFASKVSDRLFDRTSLLATQYGYDFYFDADGQATIASRNNPQSWQYQAQATPTTNLIGYWPFETTAADLSGAGNNGVLKNGPTFAAGKIGNGVLLDGLNDYVEIASTTALKYTGGGLTLSAWINADAAENNQGDIFSKPWNSSGQYNYRLIYNSSQGLTLSLTGATVYNLSTATSVVPRGGLHHVAATVDAAKNVAIYVDGFLVASDVHTVTSWVPVSGDTNSALCIGALFPFGTGWAGDVTQAFKGIIDEARIYTRALSAGEIDALVAPQAINPSAIGGRYYRNTVGAVGTPWTKQFSAFCSRIDLYVGLGAELASPNLNGGKFNVLVEVHDNGTTWRTVTSKVVSTYRVATESFFYDDQIDSSGNNLSVVTLFNLPFDEYRVTLTPAGVDIADGNASAVVRLNGIAIFERDPSTSPYPVNLSTLSNITDLRAVSNEKDIRNQVIVVGQRKATVTDSQKFLAQDNPNNPFTEFFVSVAADPSSIYDPVAPNFQGGKKVTVIVDDKVTDGDFAKWLARTVLFRSNLPNLSADVTHTPLPMLDVRDPIRIVNEKQDNMPYTVWVESIKETWGADGDAEVEIHVTAYPELPSYTPREDLDISLFQFSPAYNISASYKNIYGNVVSNPPLPTTVPTMTRVSTAVTSGSTMALPANMAPDDLYMEHPTNVRGRKRLSNHPYRHFHHISSITGTGNTRTYTLTFDFQEGDGTTGVYDQASYGFPTSWLLYGDQWVDRSAGAGTSATINPFYDPYTSEVNNLVSLKFDSLVSGFYRVSLWAATTHGEYDFPVAWLTKPEGDAEDIEAHWQYLEAGAGREFLWDGVDNIGLWNRYQTIDFSRIHEGNFLDKSIVVGKGFYAANDQSTSVSTQIGDQTANNYDVTGMPFFVKGRYSRFYLKIEAKSDKLTRTGATEIYSVNSHNDLKVISAPFYVFSHVGEPSQSYIAVEEWDDTVDKWVVGTAINHWSTINQSTGAPTIRNGKPVRVTFNPLARRGVLFYNEAGAADNTKWSGQLTRVAHMKLNVFDQFWTFYGKPWDGDIDPKNKAEVNVNNQEAKRLTNRMASDDAHTITYESDAWMSGKDMANLQWIFMPFYFQKDWGDGIKEQIRYGDYEQLYSLPGYDFAQGGGTDRKDKAFMNMAFMNYLFYLSAMTLDRSGRRQWCINPNFIDKSKIVTSTWLAATAGGTPQYATRYERFGADMYLQRSQFVRQWIEPTWKTSSGGFLALSPVDSAHPGTGGITNAFELQWVQPSILDFDPLTSPMATTGTEDMWMTAYTTQGSQVMKDFWLQAANFLTLQVRPYYKGYPTHTHNYAVSGFGSWNFNRYIYSGWFKPSPCRDFHPYWREPGMPDWATAWPGYTIDAIDNANNLGVSIMESSASHYGSAMRDFAAQSNWFGFAYSDLYFPGTAGSNLDWRGARLEEDVIAWAKQGNKFAEMANVFDYAKQDTLNRFDHFRGVFSRSPFARRKDISAAFDLDWWNANERRQAGTQPVAPSGQYLMNLANYKDYVIAPCTAKQYRDDTAFLHFAHDISTFYDIRFRHEFIWQNNRYFPVYPNGGNKYWAFKAERTGLATGVDLYDSGAWTGWKDDITSAAWTADPHLRWAELYGATSDNPNQSRSWVDGSSSTKAFHAGGYGTNAAGGALAATGAISYQAKVMGNSTASTRWFLRTNILADSFGSQRIRLAVGPRTPETRSLTMNLVLPYRLSH